MKAHVRIPRFVALSAQVLSLGGAAFAVFLISAYFAMRVLVFGSDVEVPRLLGMEVEPAVHDLAARELVLETTGSRHNALVPSGQILSQQPMPGAKLKPGRKVKVLVSLGPEQFRAPEIIGMPVPRARVLVSQDQLQLGEIAYIHSPEQQENLVVAQDPPPGAAVARDGRIDILVSRGSPEAARVMPDLVGLSLAQARRLLEENGFRVGNARARRDRSAPPGHVLRQSPLPGYPVLANDIISLVVSE
jgi:serine/threonine-protein kinase